MADKARLHYVRHPDGLTEIWLVGKGRCQIGTVLYNSEFRFWEARTPEESPHGQRSRFPKSPRWAHGPTRKRASQELVKGLARRGQLPAWTGVYLHLDADRIVRPSFFA